MAISSALLNWPDHIDANRDACYLGWQRIFGIFGQFDLQPVTLPKPNDANANDGSLEASVLASLASSIEFDFQCVQHFLDGIGISQPLARVLLNGSYFRTTKIRHISFRWNC